MEGKRRLPTAQGTSNKRRRVKIAKDVDVDLGKEMNPHVNVEGNPDSLLTDNTATVIDKVKEEPIEIKDEPDWGISGGEQPIMRVLNEVEVKDENDVVKVENLCSCVESLNEPEKIELKGTDEIQPQEVEVTEESRKDDENVVIKGENGCLCSLTESEQIELTITDEIQPQEVEVTEESRKDDKNVVIKGENGCMCSLTKPDRIELTITDEIQPQEVGVTEESRKDDENVVIKGENGCMCSLNKPDRIELTITDEIQPQEVGVTEESRKDTPRPNSRNTKRICLSSSNENGKAKSSGVCSFLEDDLVVVEEPNNLVPTNDGIQENNAKSQNPTCQQLSQLSKSPNCVVETSHLKSTNSESNTISQLFVERHFPHKHITKDAENAIIQAGRPMPLMGPLATQPNDVNSGFWVGEREYHEIHWLTGFEKDHKYYCWPCILFTGGRWSVPGGVLKEKFFGAVDEHRKSLLHITACKNLKLRESELTVFNTDFRDIVRTNRAILELLLRILCIKKTKIHNKNSNFDGFDQLMKVAIGSDPELFQPLGQPLNEDGLKDFVTRHASKLLSSVEAKIAGKISNEIQLSPFVSLIYEDTANIIDKSSQVAVIVRLLTTDGKICERFVKLVEIGSSRNAYDILEVHQAVMEEFGINDKLVGFTFSGTVLHPSSTAEFINTVAANSAKAKFFHHPDHNLKELLLQSLSHLEQCQQFLYVISELVKFLSTNSGAIPSLVAFIRHSVPNCQELEDGRSFTVDIILTIRQYYPHVIRFFSKVSQKFLNDEVAKQAPMFIKFLRKPITRFLIAVIATTLETATNLSQTMENGYDAPEWTTQAQKALDRLEELHEKGEMPYLVACRMQQTTPDTKIFLESSKSFAETFRQIIIAAMDCIYYRARKSDSFHLNSASTSTSDIIQAKDSWNRYGWPFATMEDFNDQLDFNKNVNALFKENSIPKIVEAVAQTSPSSSYFASPKFPIWQDFIRFCAMAVSPRKSTKSSPSCVLKLRYYLKGNEELNATDVLMFLEKEIVRSQLTSPEFVEEVIEHYVKKEKEINFLYDSPGIRKLEINNFNKSNCI